jgi:hypothetical protein
MLLNNFIKYLVLKKLSYDDTWSLRAFNNNLNERVRLECLWIYNLQKKKKKKKSSWI